MLVWVKKKIFLYKVHITFKKPSKFVNAPSSLVQRCSCISNIHYCSMTNRRRRFISRFLLILCKQHDTNKPFFTHLDVFQYKNNLTLIHFIHWKHTRLIYKVFHDIMSCVKNAIYFPFCTPFLKTTHIPSSYIFVSFLGKQQGNPSIIKDFFIVYTCAHP